MMTALRSLTELAVLLTPRVLEVVDAETVVGRITAHSDRQFDAFDLSGRPLGTFVELAAAESAVRAAGTESHGGAD
jgi:hypothetical protein